MAWLYERFKNDRIKLKYIDSCRQCADIYTKHFVDKDKWYQSLVLINHYPNFAASVHDPSLWAKEAIVKDHDAKRRLAQDNEKERKRRKEEHK